LNVLVLYDFRWEIGRFSDIIMSMSTIRINPDEGDVGNPETSVFSSTLT
jgi:hypothetical protein